ncbi:hypothetical protein ACI2KD_19870 [Pseudomonas monteilii]
MKRSLTCSLAVPSSLQRLLVITPLFLGSALVSASPGTTPSDDLIPEFVLYQKVDNDTENSCRLELPAVGSGETAELNVRALCPLVEGENMKPHLVRIRNVPIKSKFLLTNDPTCKKIDYLGWIELDTTRPNASLEKLGIDKLWDYPGTAERPGYVYNKGIDSGAASKGFRVIGGKQPPLVDNGLRCIVVTMAPRSN